MTSINRNSPPGALFQIVPLKTEVLESPAEAAPGGRSPARPVDQFVGSGKPLPVALSAPPPPGIDAASYGAAARKKLDVNNDGKLDKNELEAARRFADANGDGIVGIGEQKALEYLLGHDSSDFAKGQFESLHGAPGKVDRRSGEMNKAQTDAEQTLAQANRSHDQLTLGFDKAQIAMRQQMHANGIETSPDGAKVLEARLSKMGPADPARPAVEAQLAYAKMKDSHQAQSDVSYAKKVEAQAALDSLKIVNKGAQDLFAAARANLK